MGIERSTGLDELVLLKKRYGMSLQAIARRLNIEINRAGPVIRMQALKTGILLVSEKGAYEEFFTATVNEYDDLKYNRREIEENLLRRRHYA